jgi:hypothetical protein
VVVAAQGRPMFVMTFIMYGVNSSSTCRHPDRSSRLDLSMPGEG